MAKTREERKRKIEEKRKWLNERKHYGFNSQMRVSPSHQSPRRLTPAMVEEKVNVSAGYLKDISNYTTKMQSS